MQLHSVLDCRETPDQRLAGRAAIFVLLCVVDKIGLVEATVGLGA
jgi:hypothetical protein